MERQKEKPDRNGYTAVRHGLYGWFTLEVLTAQCLRASVSRGAFSQNRCRTTQARGCTQPLRYTDMRHQNRDGAVP